MNSILRFQSVTDQTQDENVYVEPLPPPPTKEVREFLQDEKQRVEKLFHDGSGAIRGRVNYEPWRNTSGGYLELVRLSSSRITYFPLVKPIVYVWCPDQLARFLPCHDAQCKGELLPQRIFASPRPMHMWDQVCYLLSRQYKCSACKKTKVGSVASYLAKLPTYVGLTFPFVLSKHSGMLKGLVTLTENLATHGVGPTAISSLLRELHTQRHDTKRVVYYSHVADRKAFGAKQSTMGSCLGNIPFFLEYSAFYTAPSPNYIRSAFLKSVESQRPFWEYYNTKLFASSRYLKSDHTFNVISLN